jgi:hypothetical protein
MASAKSGKVKTAHVVDGLKSRGSRNHALR